MKAFATCTGCGIPPTDGYTLGCRICSERRRLRLKRGEMFTATGYRDEMIDNTDPKGRIVIRTSA